MDTGFSDCSTCFFVNRLDGNEYSTSAGRTVGFID